jgi:FtsP/CotA-like multicopper oxidase with cupredoxin domain
MVAAGSVLRSPVAATLARRATPGGAQVPSFAEPPVLRSIDGALEVVLRAAPLQVPHGSTTRYALAYNGAVPGPTLRVRAGDRLVVHLENGLDHPTNLHAHGLHVAPTAEDVFSAVAPGQSRTYTYDITDDHRAGLFWYHPHVHPWVAAHVGAGLAGALVVDPPTPSGVPAALRDATERLVILGDPAVGTDATVLDATPDERMLGREGDVVLVNGTDTPTVVAAAGTLERWRVLNASPSRYYRLHLDGHPLVRIGGDQGLLPEPEPRRTLLLVPGERADLLVTPHRAGHYRLRALPYDRGRPDGAPRDPAADDARAPTLLTLRVSGTAAPARIPGSLPARVPPMPPADSRRLVDLGMAMVGATGPDGASAHTDHADAGLVITDVFTINAKTFDPARVDVAARLGTTQEWVIRNATTMDHPIHVHTWPFRVVSRSDGVAPDPGWKDTVNVPAGEEVRIRVPFTRHAGRSVYHCHILDHEDLGMMATVEVSE